MHRLTTEEEYRVAANAIVAMVKYCHKNYDGSFVENDIGAPGEKYEYDPMAINLKIVELLDAVWEKADVLEGPDDGPVG